MATIIGAIATVETVGEAINAGIDCGSCRPAIAHMLALTKENAHA
jgi:NAD(P)H-nitrite reductase large subunit